MFFVVFQYLVISLLALVNYFKPVTICIINMVFHFVVIFFFCGIAILHTTQCPSGTAVGHMTPAAIGKGQLRS